MEAPARRSPVGLAGATMGLALAVALWAARFFGENRVVHTAEWWIGDLALASVFAAPAIVGLYASMRRPRLLLVAGVVSLIVSALLLVSVVTLLAIVPASLLLVAYRRADERATARTGAAIAVLGIALIGALGLLIFAPRKPVCWRETRYADGRTVLARDKAAEDASGPGFGSQTLPHIPSAVEQSGGCTDGVFPPWRSVAALGAVAAGVLFVWRFS